MLFARCWRIATASEILTLPSRLASPASSFESEGLSVGVEGVVPPSTISSPDAILRLSMQPPSASNIAERVSKSLSVDAVSSL